MESIFPLILWQLLTKFRLISLELTINNNSWLER